jgi:hypothetical protein
MNHIDNVQPINGDDLTSLIQIQEKTIENISSSPLKQEQFIEPNVNEINYPIPLLSDTLKLNVEEYNNNIVIQENLLPMVIEMDYEQQIIDDNNTTELMKTNEEFCTETTTTESLIDYDINNNDNIDSNNNSNAETIINGNENKNDIKTKNNATRKIGISTKHIPLHEIDGVSILGTRLVNEMLAFPEEDCLLNDDTEDIKIQKNRLKQWLDDLSLERNELRLSGINLSPQQKILTKSLKEKLETMLTSDSTILEDLKVHEVINYYIILIVLYHIQFLIYLFIN